MAAPTVCGGKPRAAGDSEPNVLMERSTARETGSRTRSVFLSVCVRSELRHFATETTSAAVDRSRDALESDLRPFDGLCALKASSLCD